MTVDLGFNARQFDPSVGSGTTLEAGWYLVMITAATREPVKNKPNYSFLKLTFTIGSPEGSKGLTKDVRLNLWSDNPQAVAIAAKELSAICHVCGVLDVPNASVLFGKPFQVYFSKEEGVIVDQTTGQERKTYNNNAKEYKDAHGRTIKELLAGLSGGPAAQAAPTAAPAAPPMPAASQGSYVPPAGFAGAPQAQPSPAAPAAFGGAPAAAPGGFGGGAPSGFGPGPGAAGPGPAPGGFGSGAAPGGFGGQAPQAGGFGAAAPAAGGETQWR